SDEVLACFPETGSKGHFPASQCSHDASSFSVANGKIAPEQMMDDSGSAARFFASFPQDDETAPPYVPNGKNEVYGKNMGGGAHPGFDDKGSPARFFASFPQDDEPSAKRVIYCPKAGQDSRLGSKHPTVKPVDLIRYLVRLITPP